MDMLLSGLMLVVLFYLIKAGLESLTVSSTVSGAFSANSSRTVTGKTGEEAHPTILAAVEGTLTTRTNNTSGTLTMTSSGHGLSTGQKVDLYWTGGQCYKATLGTVSGTTVPIASVTGGDNLPAADTVINVGPIVNAPFAVEGDDTQLLVLSVTVAGYIKLVEVSGSTETIHLVRYVEPGQSYIWDVGSGIDNPIETDTITTAQFSQSGTTATTDQNSAYAAKN